MLTNGDFFVRDNLYVGYDIAANRSLNGIGSPHTLYCTVLYCTVLYCTVLYCTVLHCIILYLLSSIILRPSISKSFVFCLNAEASSIALACSACRSDSSDDWEIRGGGEERSGVERGRGEERRGK